MIARILLVVLVILWSGCGHLPKNEQRSALTKANAPAPVPVTLPAMLLPPKSPIFMVKRKKESAGKEKAFHDSQGATVTHLKHINWSIVRVPHGKGREALANYRRSNLFERAEVSKTYSIDLTPNDPLYPPMWGLKKIQAEQGWNVSTSNEVIVAVIDTGVDFDHPELAGNLWTGPNGEHGYTALGGVLTEGGREDHYHGTHVAGTIGAVGNNGLGVAGIAWRTKIISFKFLTAYGYGYTSDAAICLDRMIGLRLEGHKIRVCNNSWGASGLDPALEDAFRAAEEAGILSVCAAGNDALNTDIEPFSPACLPVDGIVSVAASDANDDKAIFSNYGTASTDLLAPGTGILSLDTNGGYRMLNGTSMASPHVAGVAAAIFGLNDALTVAQAKSVLLSPDSLDQTAFVQTTTSGGRLNMGKALNNVLIYAPSNNHPPTITLLESPAILKPGQSVTLTASGADADGDALRYTVVLRVTSDTLGQQFPTVFLPTNRITVTHFATGLPLGVEARFTVSDGRGGTAVAKGQIFMEENPAFVRPVTADLSLRPLPHHPFWELFVASPSTNAEYSLFFSSFQYTDGANCCWPANTGSPLYRGLQPGANLFRAYLWDEYGNFANSQRLVVNGGSGYIPETRVKLDRVHGTAPLRVTADFSLSGAGLTYISRLWNAKSGTEGSPPFSDPQNPVQTFTLTNLGTTAVEFVVHDPATAISDKVVQLFTVLPSGPQLTVARSGQSITLNWTQAQPTDVLEISLDLRAWTPFKTGLPPVVVPMTTRGFYRVRQ